MAEDEPGRSISGVGLTGLGIAAARATESKRPDRLFDDPFAETFLAAASGRDLLPRNPSAESVAVWKSMGDYMAIRTRFFDDFLLAASADGCGQVVVLGAGLDMRAFRLAWPEGTRLFELDTPDVLSFKEKVIAEQSWSARCERVAVGTDLREDWSAALRAAGFRSADPAAWLAEGLLRYLGADESVRLLTEVTALSATGSRLGIEQGDLATLRSPARLSALGELDPSAAEDQRAVWSGSDRNPDQQPWLATHGWQTRSQDVSELARAYGRPVPPAFGASFVTARRQPGQSRSRKR